MTEVFYVGLYTSLMGFVLAIVNTLYKSKCKEVSFCCVKVIRDVEIEERELEFTSTHPPTAQI